MSRLALNETVIGTVMVLIVVIPFMIPNFIRTRIHKFRDRKRRLIGRFSGVRYTPFAYRWEYRYRLKHLIRVLVDEFANYLVHLKRNSAVLATSVITIIVVYIIGTVFPNRAIAITTALSALVIALLIVFITAAIFMATLSRQSSNQQNKKDSTFNKSLRSNGSIMKDIFSNLIDSDIDGYKKANILSGFAAGTIFDQDSFTEFSKEIQSHKETISRANPPIVYQPSISEIARNAINWRQGNVSSALAIWREASLTIEGSNHVSSLKLQALNEACREYESGSSPDLWSQSNFLGPRLTRVILYGLLGASVPTLIQFTEYINDVSPEYQILIRVFIYLLMLTSFLGFILSIRYLVMLLEYFRRASYNYSNTAFYFWAQDIESDRLW